MYDFRTILWMVPRDCTATERVADVEVKWLSLKVTTVSLLKSTRL